MIVLILDRDNFQTCEAFQSIAICLRHIPVKTESRAVVVKYDVVASEVEITHNVGVMCDVQVADVVAGKLFEGSNIVERRLHVGTRHRVSDEELAFCRHQMIHSHEARLRTPPLFCVA